MAKNIRSIDLDGLQGNMGALIVPRKKGVLYTNQVGGYACHRPELRGYLVPVWIDYGELRAFFYGPLGPYQGYCYKGITEEDANKIDDILPQIRILFDEEKPLFAVDRSRLAEAQEAWLPVIWKGQQCILTWENSD